MQSHLSHHPFYHTTYHIILYFDFDAFQIVPGNMCENISNALVTVSVVSSLVTMIPRGSAPTYECVTIKKTLRLNPSIPPLESKNTNSLELLTYRKTNMSLVT